jgi:hypothetical protein
VALARLDGRVRAEELLDIRIERLPGVGLHSQHELPEVSAVADLLGEGGTERLGVVRLLRGANLRERALALLLELPAEFRVVSQHRRASLLRCSRLRADSRASPLLFLGGGFGCLHDASKASSDGRCICGANTIRTKEARS